MAPLPPQMSELQSPESAGRGEAAETDRLKGMTARYSLILGILDHFWVPTVHIWE